jgi:hypothetical protein
MLSFPAAIKVYLSPYISKLPSHVGDAGCAKP